MITAACRQLIAESHRYSARYAGGLFNHQPMALLALERLGWRLQRLGMI